MKCKKCGNLLSLRLGGKKLKPKQRYYFKTYLFCSECKAVFFDESQKVFLKQEPHEKRPDTEIHRSFRKEIMEIFRSYPSERKKFCADRIINFAKDIERL